MGFLSPIGFDFHFRHHAKPYHLFDEVVRLSLLRFYDFGDMLDSIRLDSAVPAIGKHIGIAPHFFRQGRHVESVQFLYQKTPDFASKIAQNKNAKTP